MFKWHSSGINLCLCKIILINKGFQTMFVSLVQSTENEEGNKSSVVLQALPLTCVKLLVT